MTLSIILEQIGNGALPDSQLLLPFLHVDSVTERAHIYAQIAQACLRVGTPEHLSISREFVQRAWNQSGFDDRLLPLYEQIHDLLDEIEPIREAYKRLGIKFARQPNFERALRFFDLWQNSYGNFRHLDKFSYDFDILDCMEQLALPYRQELPAVEPVAGRKIRIAYLMRGILNVNSALVRLDLNFSRYHDKSRFEIVYFVLEKESEVVSSQHANKTVRMLEDFGCRLVAAPNIVDLLEKLLGVNKLIRAYRPDIFVTSAALADFGSCFVTMLRPAQLVLAFASGPPPQFVIPNCHDWSIGWIKHTLLDSPVGTSRVTPFAEVPDRSKLEPAKRCDFTIPESACLLISTGRAQKFQHPLFWSSLSHILEQHTDCYLMIVGVTKAYISCLEEVLSPTVRTRIRFIPWHENYLSLLAMSDIALDTYPSGGGGTLLDSVALGIPIVSFRNNYLHQFDQTDWSLAEEILATDELIAPRGDMEAFERIVCRLIRDEKYRHEIGKLYASQVAIKASENKAVVERLEQIYIEQLEKKIGSKSEVRAELDLNNIYLESLRLQYYVAWQKAYARGYNSDMGDHRGYFYNQYLTAIGYYEELAKAQRIVEFAPGNGEFIELEIKASPQKDFWLVDISEKNLSCLAQRFGHLPNVHLVLNDQHTIPVGNIHSAFSFLLCQQMPQSLWREHLTDVYRILAPGGSYVFQFAYHRNGELANDSVPVSIAGSQKYSRDRMNQIVGEISFRGIYFTDEISLQPFDTDVIWYLCKVVK